MCAKSRWFVLFACLLLIRTNATSQTTETIETDSGTQLQTDVTNLETNAAEAEATTTQAFETSSGFTSSTTTKDFPTTAHIIEDTITTTEVVKVEHSKDLLGKDVLNTIDEDEAKAPNNDLTNDTEETHSFPHKNNDLEDDNNNNYKSISSLHKEIDDNVLQSEEDTNNPCKQCKQDVNLRGFIYNITQNEVKLSWDDIDEVEGCQYKYTTEMILATFNFTRFYNHSRVSIPTRTMCGLQEVKISAENVCGTNVEHTVAIFIPLKLYNISIIEAFSNFAFINITLPDQQEDCKLNQLIISCSDDEDAHKVYTFQEFREERLRLDGLVPFTNYSCSAELFKQDESVGNATFLVKTAQAAPTEVRNMTIYNVTDSGFIVSWIIPETIPGVLTEYRIDMSGEALYDAPHFCENVQYAESRIINRSNPELMNQIHNVYFGDLPSNFGFKVSVKAKTIDYGPEATERVSTKTPPPGEVDNLDVSVDTLVENQPVAHLRWSYPCETYASVNKVLFSIHIAENSKVTKRINKSLNEEEDLLQNLTIDLPLTPSTNYTVMIYTINLETNVTSVFPKSLEFRSPRGNTSTPLNLFVNLEEHWVIDLSWEAPRVMFGTFLHYQVNVTSLGALHEVRCKESRMDNLDNYNTNTTLKTLTVSNFVRPHRKYLVEISAVTSEGAGDVLQREFVTKSLQSQPAGNVTCDVAERKDGGAVRIHYEQPCDFNGVFVSYVITLIDEQGRKQLETFESGLSYLLNDLKPETQYKAIVVVENDDSKSIEKHCEFKTPAAIPVAPILNAVDVISKVHDKKAEVLLKDDYFEDSQGVVRYFAVLVGVAERWNDEPMPGSQGYWNGLDWPNEEFWNDSGVYQATPANWEPLKGAIKNLTFKLGTDNCTGVVNQFCNGPLKPNTEYYLAIRGYTNNGYNTSNYMSFVTDDDVTKTHNVVLIIGLVAGVLVVSTLAGIGCLYWKRRPRKPTSLEEANQIVHTAIQQEMLVPNPVKIEDFCAFYNDRKMFLCDEYEALAKFGADFDRDIGGQPENRKKNRYINILPYDCSRVPLEGCKNDYINASYIKGYSGEVEYIATQGPLESTTADFWTMVINQNCSVVAMVAQFEEHKKTKCHRYFPECREQMELYLDDGGEMMVRCAYALNFDYYIERQIIVQAFGTQIAVTHLQFLNWPDFGCPDGTANMLQFTKRLRRHMEQNQSKAVIHCSAGVGRTGTIVAVDILLQTIRDDKEINIFGIVAELREQRTKMVQAESQYLYIYQCILDHILQPMELTEIKPIDPIYENMENLIEMKVLATQNNNCDTQIEYFNEINAQTLEKGAKSDKALNDEQNEINSKKNEETKV